MSEVIKKLLKGYSAKNKARILVVDDDKSLADMLVEYLDQMGYQAVAAYAGREGLDRFEQGDFNFVILDLKMPDMGGMEVLKAIKSIDRQAVVMVLTGFGTIESAVAAIKNGAYDFITKPVKLDVLGKILRRALEKRTLSRQLQRFRGLIFVLIAFVPLWIILGVMLTMEYWK